MAKGSSSMRSRLGFLTTPHFWGGLVALVLVGAVLYVLFNNVVMPGYTRHDVVVDVPDVMDMPVESASQLLEGQGLRVKTVTQRFNPNLPRDVVVDQNPSPQSQVKPGRHIYLTVNSGETPEVQVPGVEGLSLREAKNRMAAVGLKVEQVRPDSIPSNYPNTVTRQKPASGQVVPEGSSVALWYSTGPGDRFVTIPDVTDLPVDEAQRQLLQLRLRSVVFGLEDDEDPADVSVKRQSQPAGTRVREGFELRLFVNDAAEQPEDA